MEDSAVRYQHLDHFVHRVLEQPGTTLVFVLEHEPELEDSVLIGLEDWTPADRKRIFQFRETKARTSWCVSRLLYRRVLTEWCGRPVGELTLRHNPSGKPFLPGSTKRFNWSHTAGCSVLAIADEAEVGCDVENTSHILDGFRATMRDHFSPEERFWVEQVKTDAEQWKRFVTLFVQKEAVLKRRGSGLSEALADVHCILEDVPFRNGNLYCFGHGLESRYITAVSTSGSADATYRVRMHRLKA